MRTVLVTGFDPFGGEPVNAAWEAACALDGAEIGGYRVVARQLPTELARGPATLLAAIEALDPAAVICVGQAAGREAIAIERSFVNVVDAPIPDNAGLHPRGEPVVVGGPSVLGPSIDVERAATAVRAIGLPAYVSDDAGRYVCNATAYRLAHAAVDRVPMPHGFVHVPGLPSATRSGMRTEDVTRALRAIVASAVGR